MFAKKFLTLAISVIICLSLIAGCTTPPSAAPTQAPAAGEATGKIKIGVSISNFNDTFLTYMKDGMDAYAKTLGADVEVTYVDAKEDAATQLSQIENFISQGMNAVVVVPVNTEATAPMTDALNKASIPLVYVNRLPANLPDNVVFVGSNSIDAGVFQMEYIAEKLNGKGNIVIMMGKLDNEAAVQRTAGVEQVTAKYPDIKIIKKQTAEWSRDKGLSLMENWLSSGDQIDAVAANNDDMALGAIQAIEAAGLLGKIIVGGTDATPDALAAMDAGKLDLTVFQDAAGQGGGSIKAAVALAKGETVENRVWIPFVLVTPENYKDFMTDAPAEAPAAAPVTGKLKIGVSISNFNDTFLTYMKDGMDAYAKTLGADVEVTYVDAKEDAATQLSQIENFISQGVNAVVIVPVNTEATAPMTDALNKANIPLVYVNRLPANLPDNVVFVGSNSIDAGVFQMEYLAEKLNGKGNIVIMMGKLDNEAAVQRTAGVEQVAAKYPEIKIIKKQTAEWSRDKGLSLMENWLSSGDQIDAVAANNDDMALGAIQAIEAAGLLGKIIVGGTDATPDALAAMDEGKLDLTVFQDAAGQGGGSIKAAVALAMGETVENRVWIPFVLVTPENYKEFMK